MRKKYIPCDQHWLDFFDQYEFYKTYRKLPIKNINRRRLRNKIGTNETLCMLVDFHQEGWMPIIIDKNYNLVDGQHRLAFADQMCLEYIDVAIFDESLMRNYNKKYVKNELGIFE